MWTVRKIANDDFSQDNWHFHDTVNYLDGGQNDGTDDDNNGTGNTDDYTNPYRKL